MNAKLYAERDIDALGEHYTRHVNAMTAEGLHSKSDIAAELAHRDMEIERLRNAIRTVLPDDPVHYDERDQLLADALQPNANKEGA